MTFTTRALLLTGAAICTGWGAAPVLAQEAVELDTIRVESDAAQDVLGNTRISDEEIEEIKNRVSDDTPRRRGSAGGRAGMLAAYRYYKTWAEDRVRSGA